MIRKLFFKILYLIIIFSTININANAYDNEVILNRISTPVIEYADKHFNYLNNSDIHLAQQKDLNGYKIYRIFFDDCRCGICGPPRYIMYKNDTIRMASPDEVTEIYIANKKSNKSIQTTSISEALSYCKSK